MGTGITWGQGGYRELAAIDEAYNKATNQQLENFRTLLKGGARFFDALEQALPLSAEAQAFVPQADRNWFGSGSDSMWAGNSELSGEEIHEVVRQTAIAVASLRIAGAGPVQHWCRCGFPRFEIALAWPNATDIDSVLHPAPGATGAFTVWMATPFNSGYPAEYSEDHAEGAETPYDLAVDTARKALKDPNSTLFDINKAMGQVAKTYEYAGPAFPRELRRTEPNSGRPVVPTFYTDANSVFANPANYHLEAADPGAPRGPGVVFGVATAGRDANPS